MESRGNLVITTSAGLVTLLFGLAALVTGQDKYTPPSWALGFILLAMIAFVLAAIYGLLTGAVRNYARVRVADLKETVEQELTTITARRAQRLIAAANLAVLNDARTRTTEKARLLQRAVLAEVVAVGLLAIAVIVVIADQLW